MSRMLTVSLAILLNGLMNQAIVTAAPAAQPGRANVQQQKKANAQLMIVLNNWFNGTNQIKKLEGSHLKYVYNTVFKTERRSEGLFYHETPDQGRISMNPVKLPRNPKPKYRGFTVQADPEETVWACDGKSIYRVDERKKTVQQFSIPPKARGNNIINGPLPFLLGLPPARALQRYQLKIDKLVTEIINGKKIVTGVVLIIIPKLKADSVNYKQAKIFLDTQNFYLPKAVQLIDPTGNQETVYSFKDITVTKKNGKVIRPPGILKILFPGKGQKNIPQYIAGLRKKKPPYKFVIIGAPKLALVPNLSSMNFKTAVQQLKKLGFRVKMYPGKVPKNLKLVNHIEDQNPPAGKRMRPGSLVNLLVYVKAPKLVAAPKLVVVPNLAKVGYSKAKKQLEALGFKVQQHKGSVTKDPYLAYHVQQQSPAAKTQVRKGSTVHLKLYIKPSDQIRAVAKPVNPPR